MNDQNDPVSLTSDVVFKYIFGNAGSENVLRAFLSAVQTDAALRMTDNLVIHTIELP